MLLLMPLLPQRCSGVMDLLIVDLRVDLGADRFRTSLLIADLLIV